MVVTLTQRPAWCQRRVLVAEPHVPLARGGIVLQRDGVEVAGRQPVIGPEQSCVLWEERLEKAMHVQLLLKTHGYSVPWVESECAENGEEKSGGRAGRQPGPWANGASAVGVPRAPQPPYCWQDARSCASLFSLMEREPVFVHLPSWYFPQYFRSLAFP